MSDVTFITGNQAKADYLAKLIGMPILHRKIDLDEIQTMDLGEIVKHKARQAFSIVGSPVLVEDVSLEFHALGKLPGPFIKFFLQEMTEQDICSMLDGKDRSATARCMYGYQSGSEFVLFTGELRGSIATSPHGNNGFGWDRIFIPEGYDVTRASLDATADEETYLTLKPLMSVREHLLSTKSTAHGTIAS